MKDSCYAIISLNSQEDTMFPAFGSIEEAVAYCEGKSGEYSSVPLFHQGAIMPLTYYIRQWYNEKTSHNEFICRIGDLYFYATSSWTMYWKPIWTKGGENYKKCCSCEYSQHPGENNIDLWMGEIINKYLWFIKNPYYGYNLSNYYTKEVLKEIKL